jgi:thiamine-phosphate pyrophosphorylase
MYPKLQYISQGHSAAEHLKNVNEALDAGCTWIQLRIKNGIPLEIEEAATKVRELCDKYKATFILNDHVAIAKKCKADGVHLGLDDMPVETARKILGNDQVIGGTANTIAHVLKRINEKCDYIGLGPFRFTNTKEKLSPILGLNGYSAVVSQLNETQKKIPIYAIGGVTESDIGEILLTGIYGVAVSGIITNAADKRSMVEQFNTTLYAST